MSKRLGCLTCKERLVNPFNEAGSLENSLISSISRGNLLYPSSDAVHIVTVTYIVMNKICENETFQRSFSQRDYLVNCTLSVLEDEEFELLHEKNCENNHEMCKVVKMIVWSCANKLLSNYCSKRNDTTLSANLTKRK